MLDFFLKDVHWREQMKNIMIKKSTWLFCLESKKKEERLYVQYIYIV